MTQERLALLALHLIPGVGSYTIRQLVSYCGSPSEVFKQSRSKLVKIPGIGPTVAGAIHSNTVFSKAEMLYSTALKKRIQLIFHTDDAFPHRLRHIPDAPSLLYYRGNSNLNNTKVVSIVGTRKATSYGRGQTRELVKDLEHHRPLIVSGLAYGIDAEAHRAALENNLETIGVMAGGIEYIYPATHRGLADSMESQGGLLTENGIDTVPDASRFPARNRIIAGMSDVVLVIEAAERGGALITAAIANDYNREVMAIPGLVHNKYSEGCNNLIKRHRAHLLTKAEDIEYLMNWVMEGPKAEVPNPVDLTPEEAVIVSILKSNSGQMHLDQLSWASRQSVSQTVMLLLQLEFKDVVAVRPGKIFELTHRKPIIQ